MDTKTDRELLGLAAKAHGNVFIPSGLDDFRDEDRGEWWDPLNDDGDALRLANKLRMRIEHHLRYPYVAAFAGQEFSMVKAEEPIGLDADAATRRAIVRAAAAIGSAK